MGSIMGLIGENGAGKTTTLSLILNTVKKDCGDIKIFELDHINNQKEIKEQIGVVLSESYFHDNLTPLDIEKIMKRIYKNWNSSLFENYLSTFKLPLKKIIKEYSKGMKTKLSIAVALSHNPKLLILDEATSGLDPIVRNQLLDVFLDFIQDDQHSILISSHITSDLEKIADYITFIHDGKIAFCKTKNQLENDFALLKCGANDFNKIEKQDIIGYRKNQFGYEILISNLNFSKTKYRDFIIENVSIEDIMLFYVRGEI
jgi:ABC-2 type transport system ATP-binding protein